MLSPTQLASRKVLPASAILTDPEDTRPYECDGLTLFRQQPMVVLLDGSGNSRGSVVGYENPARFSSDLIAKR